MTTPLFCPRSWPRPQRFHLRARGTLRPRWVPPNFGRRSRGRSSFGLRPHARTWSHNRLARTWARSCRKAGVHLARDTGPLSCSHQNQTLARAPDACSYPGPIGTTNLRSAPENATCPRCMEPAYPSNGFSVSVGLSGTQRQRGVGQLQDGQQRQRGVGRSVATGSIIANEVLVNEVVSSSASAFAGLRQTPCTSTDRLHAPKGM